MSKTIFAAILLLSASFANASAGVGGSFVSHGVFLEKDSSLVAQPSCGSVNGVEGVPAVAVSPAERPRLGVAGDATAGETRYFAEAGFTLNGGPAWKIHVQAGLLPATATTPRKDISALAHVYCSFPADRAS